MLRAFLLYLSQAGWARQIITNWDFAWRAASRFVAGENLDDAIRIIKILIERNINATLDHLGEHTSNPEKASNATEEIIEIIKTIDLNRVKSNVSIKLTQIGLEVDENICAENLFRILEVAAEHKTFVRIDMEDSRWVEKTLQLFNAARKEFTSNTIGIVIQSYLYRSQQDVADLIANGSRIRLCKGAYNEPEDIAFPKKSDVDSNFDRLVDDLFAGALSNGAPIISGDGKIPPIPAIATHDEKRVLYTKEKVVETGFPKAGLEFQMLYGIRRDLQESLAEEGYPVRVYVPYGSEWYPYFTRRLAESPANLWFFISNYFKN